MAALDVDGASGRLPRPAGNGVTRAEKSVECSGGRRRRLGMQGNRAYALMPRGRIPGGETVRKAAGRTHSGIMHVANIWTATFVASLPTP